MAETLSREQEHCAFTSMLLEHAHAALVEQPVTAAARSTAPDRSVRCPRPFPSSARPSTQASSSGDACGVDALRRVAGIAGRAPRMRSGALRQELQHDAAGAPAVLGAALAGAEFLGDREPHAGRNLLRAQKIFVRRLFEACRLRARPGPDNGSCRRPGRSSSPDDRGRATRRATASPAAIAAATALLVEARAGAHLAAGRVIDHQHAHRTVGLGLQDEAAVEFQRGAEQGRERDGFAEQLRDRQRIIVARQDFVDRGPSRTTRPRKSSAATSKGRIVSSRDSG